MFNQAFLQAKFQTHPDSWDTETWAQVQEFAAQFYAARGDVRRMFAIKIASVQDFFVNALPQARACWDAAHVEVKVVDDANC